MRVTWTCHIARYAAQIKFQYARINGGFQGICPQACGFGVGFHQFHLRVVATGQFQIINGLLINSEHRGSRPELRGHVGNGGTVADGQASCTFAEKFDKCTNHALFTQEFSQCQHDVGGSNARLAFAGQLNADDIRQTHHGGTTQHYGFGFQTAHAYGNHAQ